MDNEAKHHHCLISGTGRTGTTFLVMLLTHLNVDTGYTIETAIVDNPGRAGLERNTITRASPYLIKSPHFCDHLEGILAADPNLVLDCVILPVRAMNAAAESRADVQARTTGSRGGSGRGVRGGLWQTENHETQQAVLHAKLCSLIECVARHEIPTVLLWYPRLVQEPNYIFGKLRFLFPSTPYEEFERIFKQVARSDLVHQFSTTDTA